MASITAIAVAAGAVAVLAVTSEGYSATSVDVNDGGVWVTRPAQLGRLNTQLDMLDAATGKGLTPDVVQEGGLVFTIVPDGTVARVDPATLQQFSPLQLPSGYSFDMRGGTGVVWDRQTGKAWIRPATEILGLDLEELKDKPDVTAGADADAVVGADGAVHLVSVDKDVLVTVPAPGSDDVEPVSVPLGHDVTTATITAVGAVAVVLDRDAGRVIVPGAADVALDAANGPVLQQAGPQAPGVLVGVDGKLLEVPLEGGNPRVVADVPGTNAVAPARVGDRSYGAWNTTPWILIEAGGAVTENQAVDGIGSPANLRIRVNRANVALNDLSGKLWVLDDTIRKAQDNWDEADPADKPKESTTPDDSTVETERNLDRSGPNRPPRAENDEFGARPGQGAILRVLVNDIDPDGDVLVIESVSEVPESVGRLDIIDDGQSLQFTPEPASGGTTATFRYVVNDGRGKSDAATVTVSVPATGDKNRAPEAVEGRVSATVVEAGRTVTYNVMDDWRDPDGDPLQLKAATSSEPSDTVRFNPDGTITVTAGTQVGKRAIDVTLTDGTDSTTGKLGLQVRPAGPLEPSARPDHYLATAGEALLLTPLANDNDPNGDAPAMIKVEKRTDDGLSMTEDLTAGTIRFSATQPGSYTFLYYISGGAEPVPGVIRVDVREKEKNSPPVAVLDVVTLGADLTALVDVVANDSDADGDVLVVTSVSDEPGVTVAVREHRVLQISAAKVPERDILLTYVVTDGKTTPVQGSVVVRKPVFGDGQNQPPTANPDRAVVRVGDVVSIPVLDNDTDSDGDPLTLEPDVTGMESSGGLAFVTGARDPAAGARQAGHDQARLLDQRRQGRLLVQRHRDGAQGGSGAQPAAGAQAGRGARGLRSRHARDHPRPARRHRSRRRLGAPRGHRRAGSDSRPCRDRRRRHDVHAARGCLGHRHLRLPRRRHARRGGHRHGAGGRRSGDWREPAADSGRRLPRGDARQDGVGRRARERLRPGRPAAAAVQRQGVPGHRGAAGRHGEGGRPADPGEGPRRRGGCRPGLLGRGRLRRSGIGDPDRCRLEPGHESGTGRP